VNAFKHDLRKQLEAQAHFFRDRLAEVRGLTVLDSGGAMYAIIRIDGTSNNSNSQHAMTMTDVEFTEQLLHEENVFVLPGACFGLYEGSFVRVAFCASLETLDEAANRIEAFCDRHFSDD
jgi:aspartate/methionine/tyrosine aminotransferase